MTYEEFRMVFLGLTFTSGFILAVCALTWLFGRKRRT